jgi:uncharacterized membrane protein YczE
MDYLIIGIIIIGLGFILYRKVNRTAGEQEGCDCGCNDCKLKKTNLH